MVNTSAQIPVPTDSLHRDCSEIRPSDRAWRRRQEHRGPGWILGSSLEIDPKRRGKAESALGTIRVLEKL